MSKHSNPNVDLIREALEYQEQHSLMGPLFPEAQEELRRLVEQFEAQQRLLFAADEAFRWVAQEYPKVIREMPPNLYRELREARVPRPLPREMAEYFDGTEAQARAYERLREYDA